MIELESKNKSFSAFVEDLVKNHNVDYYDASMEYARKYDMEIEALATLINRNQKIKAEIYNSCMKLNLVEKVATLDV